MKKAWICLGIIALALTLGACCPKCKDTYQPSPCYIPNDLTDDAIGKLGIRIIRTGDDVRVIIPSDHVFEVNSGQIKQSAYPGLNLLAKKLNTYGAGPMTISAYTDELGAPYENKWIAEQQARSLQTFLWTRGYSQYCMTPIGVGEDYSGTVASNRSVLGSAANRRVEITFRAKPQYEYTWF